MLLNILKEITDNHCKLVSPLSVQRRPHFATGNYKGHDFQLSDNQNEPGFEVAIYIKNDSLLDTNVNWITEYFFLDKSHTEQKNSMQASLERLISNANKSA